MKKKRGRRIAMLLAMMMLVMNLIVSPVWAGQGDVAINETNFPNYYFRNYVSKKLDKDHDGKLSDAEIAGIKSIDVRDIYLIKNLKGIEYFTALQTLNCDGNRLSTLDISKNAALQKLVCSNNQLTNLDVSNNPALKTLNCSYNTLSTLDVSNNPALEYINCDYSKLTNLDVSNNPALQTLHCYNNRLKNLDVSNSPALQTLHCDANFLTNLDVSNNSALEYLYCEANKLTNLDVSKNPALQTLHCYSNKLTSLDVSKNPALQELRCGLNKLTSLDISKNSALQKLECDNNKLTSLDISKNSALQKLDCNHNQLTNLDLSNNPALQKLECWTNQLTNLDLSNNPALQQLGCSKNQLTSLDISKNTALKDLYCSENQLTSLDVSKNTALEYIDCSENQLTSFDVSKNTALEDLYCSENQLTNLDVSNPALETLDCGNNQLTNLDLSKNSALWSLNCIKNKLTVLDVSKNTALGELRCYNNQLTNLDLSNNTRISDFDGDNQTYDVKVKTSDMKIVYTDFPGNFDITKATDDIEGADSNFIVDASKPSTVTYDYDTGLRGRYFEVTLNITYVYTVTFNTNGGTAINPQTITAGGKVTKPADPTKDGYTFAGWYKEAALTTPFDFATETINADTTIYAKWTQNPPVPPTSYTVTFNTNGGTAINPQTITAGEHVTKPADPTKDGYTFAGWYKEAEFTTAFDFATETINADITLYAKWNENPPTTYTVTFNANGHGTAPASITVNKGAVATKPADPTDADYDFGGWYTEAECTNEFDFSQAVNADITLYAKWTEKTPPTQYTLTATVDGGHGSVTPASKTVNKDETVTLTFTPETGYELDTVTVNGTVTGVIGNVLDVKMNENKTVIVKFKAVVTPPIVTPVTITFDKNGGTGTMADVTKNKGESFTLPACGFIPPAGKEFKAWQVDGTEKNVGDNIVLNGDKTIKAVWKDIGSVPPTPPVPPTPYIPGPTPYPYPYPWTRYPGYWYNIETPKPKEEKPVNSIEIDWKLELSIGIDILNREINGVQSKIKMDIAPYIRDGRTMLPIRYVAEALGFDVEWNRSTRIVVLRNSSTRVEIPVDTNKIIVNGEVYTSDVKPEIKNNRTMLPIANIARALGLKDGKDIIWNSKSKMVTIYRSIVVK